jgi:hypothetical protein
MTEAPDARTNFGENAVDVFLQSISLLSGSRTAAWLHLHTIWRIFANVSTWSSKCRRNRLIPNVQRRWYQSLRSWEFFRPCDVGRTVSPTLGILGRDFNVQLTCKMSLATATRSCFLAGVLRVQRRQASLKARPTRKRAALGISAILPILVRLHGRW